MKIKNLGLIEYGKALERQLILVDSRSRDLISDTILFCSHPPVVTLGRGSLDNDILNWSGPIKEVSRGGRATFHGPHQLIGYPIISLLSDNLKFSKRDVYQYLRFLENVLVKSLNDLDIDAHSKMNSKEDLLLTGVWLGEKKIASIGVAVRKWVTYHGFALNVFEDTYSKGSIRPCGFSEDTISSIEVLTERSLDLDILRELISKNFNSIFYL